VKSFTRKVVETFVTNDRVQASWAQAFLNDSTHVVHNYELAYGEWSVTSFTIYCFTEEAAKVIQERTE
jgi:hypothetical protein